MHSTCLCIMCADRIVLCALCSCGLRHTLVTRALALTHTRRRCDGCKSVPDCFLLPPHSWFGLDHNLACVPLTIEARAACTDSYSGPATLCISCEAGKFATTSSPCCSSLYNEPPVLLRTQQVRPRLRTQREHEMPEPNMRMTFAILAR
jgi:hypothetical protein